MNERVLTEVLAAHADQLLRGEAREDEYLTLFTDRSEELAPLLSIARQIKEVMARVQPSEAFRRRLYQELVAAHQRMAAHLERGASLPAQRPVWRRPWVIGAAALGSVVSVASAVGVIAYLRRAKPRKPAAVVS